MESVCVSSAQQVKEPNPNTQVLIEAEFQCTVWGQPPPLLRGLGGPQGKSSLFSFPQTEELAPCHEVPTTSPFLRKSHTQGPGVRSVLSHCTWAPNQGPGGCMEGLDCFWGEGCSLPTPLTIPHCTLQSRLCAQLRSITSTPHVPAMGGIIQHHPIAQRRRARPREGR